MTRTPRTLLYTDSHIHEKNEPTMHPNLKHNNYHRPFPPININSHVASLVSSFIVIIVEVVYIFAYKVAKKRKKNKEKWMNKEDSTRNTK